MAALVFRRGELLREFHRERIRLDMILCDLAETERAMTACFAMPAAGWGAWVDRSSMHQSEETLYRNPWSSEETSWWCGNPSEPVIPFYPHVERSPSPVLQQRLVDDAEQQECGSSSRALAVAPSSCPDVEQRWSLRKEPAVEALVQAAINVVANPTETALFSQKVTPESRAAVNQEQEQQLKDGHGVQLTESGIQRREQPKCLTTGEEHEAEAKDIHAMQFMESELHRIEHPMHPAIGHEREEEVKDNHAMQLMECEVQRNGPLNHAAIVHERETKGNTSHAVQVMESKLQKSEQVKRGAVGRENKAEVKDNHEVLMESEIQRPEQPNRAAIGQGRETKGNTSHAVQVMESKFQKGEQVKRGAVGQENKAEMKDNHEVLMESEIQIPELPNRAAIGQGCETKGNTSHAVQVMESKFQKSEQVKRGTVGQENKAEVKDNQEVLESEIQRTEQPNRAAIGHGRETKANASHAVQVMENKFQKSEQVKRGAIGQERKAEVKDNHEVLMKSEIQRIEQPKHEASGQEHGEEENDRHAAQPMEESGIQSSEQPKPAERTINERIGEPRQLSHRYALAAKEKSPPNEQKRQVFDDRKTQITTCGVKRKPIMRINRYRPHEQSNCALGMNLTCDEDLTQHQAGELHRSNFEVLQSRQGAAGLTAKSTPESSHRPRLHPISNNDMESEQPKRSALGQEHEAEAKNSHTVQLMENKIQRRQKTREALGEEHKAEEKDSHAEQLMKESGIQNREQQKPAEPTFRDDTDEHMQSPHVLPVKEKSPSNEHKIVAFNETRTQITPSVLKRPIFKPTMITPPAKRHKPLDDWSCTLCQANLTCEEDLTQHKEGELHRSKLAALRARHEASGFDLRNHLRGRSHQESTQALNTEEGGKCAIDRRGEDPKNKFMGNRRFPFCKLCKVECTSQKVMESHLVGKKHRENLLARH
ncbi:hypothetical protein QYE76_005263 [Lolium multiflorum]|uniref:C2H2-type domain-containing protein n=1 Tax=Lolium multiflorum TaxID=4521 RepID=A0AAD8W2Z2_LOLMU|nr:hypothetical protein QYE76_005263 [Lolium multiflorum]